MELIPPFGATEAERAMMAAYEEYRAAGLTHRQAKRRLALRMAGAMAWRSRVETLLRKLCDAGLTMEQIQKAIEEHREKQSDTAEP